MFWLTSKGIVLRIRMCSVRDVKNKVQKKFIFNHQLNEDLYLPHIADSLFDLQQKGFLEETGFLMNEVDDFLWLILPKTTLMFTKLQN